MKLIWESDTLKLDYSGPMMKGESMKIIASNILRVIEWLLIVAGVVIVVPMIIPYSDMYSFNRDLREAKAEGIFYKGPEEKQTFFESKLTIKGVIYDGEDLNVYVRGCRFSSGSKLPQQAIVHLPNGETLGPRSWGGTSNLFCDTGVYLYEDVPSELIQITFGQESYGESFSFVIPLEKEAAE